MEKNEVQTLNNPDLVKILFEKSSKDNRLEKIEGLVHRKIGKRVKFLLDKAFELADGIYMLDERDPDKVKYYKKAPNLDAIIYLIDRLIGKPVAKQENKETNDKKGVQAVQNIIIQLAGQPVKQNENERSTITIGSDNVRSGQDTL